MKTDPNQPDDPDRTQPVEVQRYGPEVHPRPGADRLAGGAGVVDTPAGAGASRSRRAAA